jgi:hypothetical protein
MSSFAPGTDPRVIAEFERRFYGARVPGMVQGAEAQVTPQLAVRDAGRVDDYNRMVSGIPGFPSFNAARTVGGQTLGSMPSGNAGLSSDAMTPEGQQMLANLKLPEYRVPPPARTQDLPEALVSPPAGMQQQQRFSPYQQFQQFQQFNPYQQFQQPQFNPFMGGLGGLFSQMGGYGMGYNPMMGGFGGGFGGFNPYMGGGFGGFGGGFNPYMGSGFGGGFNPMMGGGQGFGGYNPQSGASPFGGGFGGGFGSRGFMNQMGGGFGGQQGVGGQGPNSFQG